MATTRMTAVQPWLVPVEKPGATPSIFSCPVLVLPLVLAIFGDFPICATKTVEVCYLKILLLARTQKLQLTSKIAMMNHVFVN